MCNPLFSELANSAKVQKISPIGHKFGHLTAVGVGFSSSKVIMYHIFLFLNIIIICKIPFKFLP